MAAAACGDDRKSGREDTASPPPGQTATRDTPAREAEPNLEPARCPVGSPNCRVASGRIVYVEALDPDGDGDAHFVLASSDSITAPGVSVIDVKRSLRPDPLPGLGEHISAAGPVYKGSYGQRQIEATELNVASQDE